MLYIKQTMDLPSEKLHPSIFHAEELIKMISELYEIVMFMIFTDTPKKQNIFSTVAREPPNVISISKNIRNLLLE